LVPNLKFGRGPQRGELRRQLTKLRGKQSVLAFRLEVDEAPCSAFPIIHTGSNNPRHTVTFALAFPASSGAITSKGNGWVRSGRIEAAAANKVTRTVIIVVASLMINLMIVLLLLVDVIIRVIFILIVVIILVAIVMIIITSSPPPAAAASQKPSAPTAGKRDCVSCSIPKIDSVREEGIGWFKA
jgi:hypothetical protein